MAIKLYKSGGVLLSEVQTGTWADVYFLDVEMSEMDGFTLGAELRKIQPQAVIVFVTSHGELAAKGYPLGAFRYISKLDLKDQINEALPKIVASIIKQDSSSIILACYNNGRKLMLKDIVHVRAVHRKLEITTDNAERIIDTRGLNAFFEELSDKRFVFIERSHFVNLDYVSRIDGAQVYLNTDEVLYASRKFLPKVKAAIMSLWGT